MRVHAIRLMGLAAGLASSGLALGQNNSLLGAGGGNASGRAPAAEDSPARPAPEIILVGPPAPANLRPDSKAAVNSPNPELVAVSPIARATQPPRTIEVHDLVTVIVREEKRSESDSEFNSEKNWELTSALNEWIRLNEQDKLVPQNFTNGIPRIDFEFDSQYEGEGEVSRRDSLTARITAEVIDVKPNGTLVLEATKSIVTDEEVQTITLSGICRSEDVTPTNTILSTQLAKVELRTNHTGSVRDAARRGWLMRFFDLIRPF